MPRNYANFASWTLDGAINDTVTSITVNEATTDAPSVPFRASVGTEVVLVTASDTGTKTFTVRRGHDDTTAAAQSDGARLQHTASARDYARPLVGPRQSVPPDDPEDTEAMTYTPLGYPVWYDGENAPPRWKGLGDNIAAVVNYLRAAFGVADQSITNGQTLGTDEGVEEGSLAATVLDGALAIASNRLSFTAQTTPAWTDCGVAGEARTRIIGRALKGTVRAPVTNKNAPALVWADAATLGTTVWEYVMRLANTNQLLVQVVNGGAFEESISAFAYSSNTDYRCVMILGGYNAAGEPYRAGEDKNDYGYGCSFFYHTGSAWRLLWRTRRYNTSTLYPVLTGHEGAGTIDTIAVSGIDASAALLPTDYDLAPTTGTTYTHAADCLIEFEIAGVPLSTGINVSFREQDTNNKWIVNVFSGGTLLLYEVVAGTSTARGSVSYTPTVGDRIVVLAVGTSIKVFVNGTERISYASASNFASETDGEVVSLGTGGAIDDLASYPRAGDATILDLL